MLADASSDDGPVRSDVDRMNGLAASTTRQAEGPFPVTTTVASRRRLPMGTASTRPGDQDSVPARSRPVARGVRASSALTDRTVGGQRPALGRVMVSSVTTRQCGAAESPRVVIVGDDPLALSALRSALSQAGATVTGQARSATEAIDLSRDHIPDIALVDLPLPESLPLVARLVGLNLGVRPILLTLGRDPEPLVAALRLGARGFLVKGDILDCDLSRLLRSAIGGDLVCSRGMATTVVSELLTSPKLGVGFRPVASPLTDREWEVLDLLCSARSTDEIADEFVVSIETVRSHIKNILRKIGAKSRAEAIILAADLRQPQGPTIPERQATQHASDPAASGLLPTARADS